MRKIDGFHYLFYFFEFSELCEGCREPFLNEKHMSQRSESWDYMTCTLVETTDAYGELRFFGSVIRTAKVRDNTLRKMNDDILREIFVF